MGKINVLDRQVANLIAAGEVVDRPMSVAKELTENAIDAGATSVTVEIRHGGASFLRVTDNGAGMERDDVPRAFLRHATSKVRTEQDLTRIGTLGFRGEALAAIAAVSKVALMTRQSRQTEGTLYRIEGGEEIELAPAGCPDGTTVTVRDLFFNTPARMKFLKKDATESAAIAALMDKFALSHPEIAFCFIRDGRPALQTTGDGDLSAVVFEVYGRDSSKKMLPVDSEHEGIRVSGFVGAPLAARPNRNLQNFFLNGRMVKAKTFTYALEEAFHNKIMTERYPICALAVELDTALVDVNVHPTKLEVKFANERRVYEAVYFAVCAALDARGERDAFELPRAPRAAARFDVPAAGYTQQRIGSPTRAGVAYAPPKDEPPARVDQQAWGYRGESAAVKEEPAAAPRRWTSEPPAGPARPAAWPRAGSAQAPAEREENAQAALEALLPDGGAQREAFPAAGEERAPCAAGQDRPGGEPAAARSEAATAPGSGEELSAVAQESFRLAGELYHTYLIVEVGDDVYFIDKHAAQERMTFERLCAAQTARETQTLLAPVMVPLTREEAEAVGQNLPVFEQLGFALEDFGDGSFLCRGAPIGTDEGDIPALVEEVAGELLRGKRDARPRSIDDLLHSIACKASMKGGQKNAPEDLEDLVAKLLALPDIRYCPHGRPVALVLSRRYFEKQFRR